MARKTKPVKAGMTVRFLHLPEQGRVERLSEPGMFRERHALVHYAAALTRGWLPVRHLTVV